MLLGAQSPVTQWTQRNSNLLTGLGTSLLSDGMNFQPAQVGATLDRQAAAQKEADAKLAASTNATRQWLAQNYPDLAQAVDAGLPVSDAWQEAFKRQQPGYGQTANPSPIKIGAGETLLDPVTYQPLASGPIDDKEAFNREKDLSAQYVSTDPVKTYQTIRNGYEKIRSSAALDSGPGDISTIFAYMKMLDPTSVVREGEFATAENAGGVGGQIANLYNKVLSGERLTPELRKQFLASADQIYKEASGNLTDINSQYSTRATGWNVDPSRFIISPETYGANDPLGLR